MSAVQEPVDVDARGAVGDDEERHDLEDEDHDRDEDQRDRRDEDQDDRPDDRVEQRHRG